MDLHEFANLMRSYGDKVVENGNLLKRRVALAVDTAVVLATPVDTGRARANWQGSLDTPATSTIDPYVEGKGGSTGAANAQAALDQASAVFKGSVPGQPINITNNLPYIGRLNDGHSAQAPVGFVEAAVLVGVEAIRNAPPIVTGDYEQ